MNVRRTCVNCGREVAADRERFCDHCGLPFAVREPDAQSRSDRRPGGGRRPTARIAAWVVITVLLANLLLSGLFGIVVSIVSMLTGTDYGLGPLFLLIGITMVVIGLTCVVVAVRAYRRERQNWRSTSQDPR